MNTRFDETLLTVHSVAGQVHFAGAYPWMDREGECTPGSDSGRIL